MTGTMKLFAGLLAGGVIVTAAQAGSGSERASPAPVVRGATPSTAHKSSIYRPLRVPSRAKAYYLSIWGVDNFLVRRTASGNLIRFSYRVVDPLRAQVLSDDRVTPHLIDPKRGVVLQIPSLEQVGDLRQKGKPIAGKEYWMVFSNKDDPVKAGDHVSVVIGSFHADGLLVE
ncbi:MAG: hypothetical protein WBX11_02085 [Thiobacillaceae bacterium]